MMPDMSIYIDKPRWLWKGRLWCHLTADTLPELHRFARKLGLRREWFQDGRYPHYDTVFYDKAVELGALSVRSRVIVEVAKKVAKMSVRAQFESLADKQGWRLTRSKKGDYVDNHVEYAFIGFCMALGVDHRRVV